MNRSLHTGFPVFIAAALISITSCSIPGRSQQPQKQYFVLQDTGVSTLLSGPGSTPCRSLRISTPGSAPGLNTARMAYSTAPNRLDYFAYHEWLAPPAKMFVSMMESRLQAAGLFSVILVNSPDIRTDLRLDSEVQLMQQDFTGSGYTYNLAIRTTLVEVKTRSLLGSETFRYNETAAGGDAEAGAETANRVANRFLDDLTAFLAAVTEKMECPD